MTRLLAFRRPVCLCHFDMFARVAFKILTRVTHTRVLVSIIHVFSCHLLQLYSCQFDTYTRVKTTCPPVSLWHVHPCRLLYPFSCHSDTRTHVTKTWLPVSLWHDSPCRFWNSDSCHLYTFPRVSYYSFTRVSLTHLFVPLWHVQCTLTSKRHVCLSHIDMFTRVASCFQHQVNSCFYVKISFL